MQNVKSTCPYCGVGCGVSIGDASGKMLVLGDDSHPANFGKLCSKGSALGDTLHSDKYAKRLTQPTVDDNEVSWDQATQDVADRINHSIETHGRDSVAFYLSGQLLTEDYYVANKLMKGYIGTANVDTNSRLCMSSAVSAYKRAFGADAVPCSYEDIDATDLIVLIGSNAAWTHPVLYQRMVTAKQANPNLKVVLIDPRKTASCDIADLHLALKPSSDGFLFNGLLHYLCSNNAIDSAFIQRSTHGFESVLASVKNATIDQTATKTSLGSEQLIQFFEWFATTKKVISFYSMGINQSESGTDKCNAIINCHLATGRIGKAGAGPFSITGQPNAMGGREVGGLSNQLAAHMDFSDQERDRVQRYWNSPLIAVKPGLKAVELFDAVAVGKIKVIWIMATNPAVSLPDSNRVRQALELCPTVIVSDVTRTDTTDLASIVLPAQGWSEKDGTVTNSERRISRQRGFQTAPGSAKADWQILCEVARKMGFSKGFNYQSPHQIFNEHAGLSAFENSGNRAFNIGALQSLSADEYNNLSPIQWPVNDSAPNGTERLFSDGVFFTQARTANFIVTKPRLADNVNRAQGFILNTGRLRDQWHTMTRTGNVSKLSGHDDIPCVQTHPDDALDLGLQDYDMVQIGNGLGQYTAQVKITTDVKRKQLFCPIHWSDQFAKNAVVSSLVSSHVDPVSGQPQLKSGLVSIEKVNGYKWARIASLKPINRLDFDYWTQTKTARGYISLVGFSSHVDWLKWCRMNVNKDVRLTRFVSDKNDTHTILGARDDSIELLLYSHGEAAQLPSFNWLATAFDENQTARLPTMIRSEVGSKNATICSCFGTSKKAIEASIKGGASDVFELGSQLGCGSKCGSCKPELSALIRAQKIA